MSLALFNVIFVLLGAVIAFFEERFWDSQFESPRCMSWVQHGGMWADLLIISAIAWIVSPYLSDVTSRIMVLSIIAGIVASFLMHMMYIKWVTFQTHMIDPTKPYGFRRLTWGGWYHMCYMAVVIAIIVMYFVGTDANKFWVSVLLSVFIIPAVLQPGWYAHRLLEGRGYVDANGWVQAIALLVVIWGTFWWFSSPLHRVTISETPNGPTIEVTETQLPFLATKFDDSGEARFGDHTVIRYWKEMGGIAWTTNSPMLPPQEVSYFLVSHDRE